MRLADHIVWKAVAGIGVVVDLRERRTLGVNGAACFLLTQLESESGDDPAPRLAAHFGLSIERAEHDVRAFVAELSRRGMLEGNV